MAQKKLEGGRNGGKSRERGDLLPCSFPSKLETFSKKEKLIYCNKRQSILTWVGRYVFHILACPQSSFEGLWKMSNIDLKLSIV